MKKNNRNILIAVAVVTAVISWLIASSLFNSPSKHNLKAPSVQSIPSAFPDVKNDPTYNTFLNESALDATQSVKVGGSQNSSPFNQ